MQKSDENVSHCYNKITKYNPCIQNIIIHTLPAIQADYFSDEKIKEVIAWVICKKKLNK